ncbi:hypothetical protein F511_30486 [Dorcoceras hygrometricum]|uniref:Uncharacterized protein n=1 Tax=Dorcoceras hygrometricum TaxID=472368 RepID=A0A2Z7B4J9_9LAMI|nr:hypothetical protein F511_30486 [Dorcoceras hygrometricum]
MSLFDLQDVCIAIGSIATLDLPMVVDLIGIYGLKGPYCTLTTTNSFYLVTLAMSLFDLQDVCIAIGSIATLDLPMVVDLIGIYGLKGPYSWLPPLPSSHKPPPPPLCRRRRRSLVSPENCSGQLDKENPSVPISSGLLVQADEGVSYPVVDLIDVIYRSLPRSAGFLEKLVGSRHELPVR